MLNITWEWDFGNFLFPQVIRGIGLMFCIVPINSLALGTLPPQQLKNASGLYNLMRNLGGALGLAVINTVLIHRVDFHKSRLREAIEPGRPVIDQALSGLGHMMQGTLGADGNLAALKSIYGLMTREATVMAFADTFYVLALCFLAMLLTLPVVKKPQAMTQTAAKDAH
jgi:DHA2 family multidrug resistance protein